MATLTIDTYSFIERLTQEGIPKHQARAIADGLKEASLDHVSTKEDLLKLKVELMKMMFMILFAQAGLIVALIKFL